MPHWLIGRIICLSCYACVGLPGQLHSWRELMQAALARRQLPPDMSLLFAATQVETYYRTRGNWSTNDFWYW